MKKVLITGKGSYVGEHVKEWLLKTPDLFDVDTVDTMNDKWLEADFSKYDTVYHVAGIAEVNGNKDMKDLYYAVNRDLTIRIAKHAKENGVRHFIFMSSMIVYKESQSLKDEVITKDTKPDPNGFYGDSKYMAEQGLHALTDESFKVCILRPPMIYGPNSKSNLLRLADLGSKVPLFPKWHNQRSILYIENLAEFVKHAILNELSGLHFPQDSKYLDTVELIRFVSKEKRHKIIISRLLNPFVWVGSFVLQPVNKIFATYKYSPEMSKETFHYQIVAQKDAFKTLI